MASVLAFCLLVGAPAYAFTAKGDPGVEIAGSVVAPATSDPQAEQKPAVKLKPRYRGKGRRHSKRHGPPHPTIPLARLEPVVKPSLAGRLRGRLGQAGVLVGAASLGVALLQRRCHAAIKRSKIALEEACRNADIARQDFAAENQILKQRALVAESKLAEVSTVNGGLKLLIEGLNKDVRRLEKALAEAIVEREAKAWAPADIDLTLQIPEDELPDDAVERQRLLDEGERLQKQWSAVRKAAQASTPAVSYRPLLNNEEDDVFRQAHAWAKANRMRLNPQASMGEFLVANEGSHWSMVFGAFNPRRVDILVSDWSSNPMFAIEHQGTGHKQGNWRLHDAIKHQILRIADLPLVETVKGEPDDVVHGRLNEALAQAPARSRRWSRRKSQS